MHVNEKYAEIGSFDASLFASRWAKSNGTKGSLEGGKDTCNSSDTDDTEV